MQTDTQTKFDHLTACINQMSQAMAGNAATVPNVIGAPIAGQNAAPPTPQSQKPSGSGGSDSQNSDTESSKSGKHSKRTKRTKKTKRRSTLANSPPRPKKSQDDDTSSLSSHGRAVDQSDFDYEGENDTTDDKRQGQRNKYRRKPNSLPMKEFNFGDKAADWTSWIKKFENIVFAAEEPSTREEHHKSNIKWLPAYLNTLAHDIFVSCKNRKNWAKLKRELEDAFDDPEVKQKWRTDLQAYKWDEVVPLHVYKGNVTRFVNKFDIEIRNNPGALRSNYFTRFVGGLPKDYKKFLDQQLYEDKQTVEHAVRAAQKFLGIKNDKIEEDKQIKRETGAAGFESSSGDDRLRLLEQENEELRTSFNTLENMVMSSNQTPPRTPGVEHHDYNNARFANQAQTTSSHPSYEGHSLPWSIANSADLSTDFGANAMATHSQSSPLSYYQHPRRDRSNDQ